VALSLRWSIWWFIRWCVDKNLLDPGFTVGVFTPWRVQSSHPVCCVGAVGGGGGGGGGGWGGGGGGGPPPRYWL